MNRRYFVLDKASTPWPLSIRCWLVSWSTVAKTFVYILLSKRPKRFLQKSCLNRLIHQLKSFPLWKMLNQLYQCINNDQPYESIAKMSQKPSKKAEPFFALSVFCLQRLRRKQPALFWHLQPLQPSRQIVESIEHEVLIWAVLGTGLPSRKKIKTDFPGKSTFFESPVTQKRFIFEESYISNGKRQKSCTLIVI